MIRPSSTPMRLAPQREQDSGNSEVFFVIILIFAVFRVLSHDAIISETFSSHSGLRVQFSPSGMIKFWTVFRS